MRFAVGSKHRGKRGGSWTIESRGAKGKDGSVMCTANGPDDILHFLTEKELAKQCRKPRIPGVVYLSASQITVFVRCKRKWAFSYIDKVPVASRPDQDFGTECHDALEHYLKEGELPLSVADDVKATVMQGIESGRLPTPGTGIHVEHEFNWKILGGKAIVNGFMDILVPPEAAPEGVLRVVDHKTTKDPRYAMKAEALDEDVQAIIYSKVGMTETLQTKVQTEWLYYIARPNKARPDGRPRTPRGFRPVSRPMTIEHVNREWAKLEKVSEQMVVLKKAKTPAKEVEANPLACGDYGGCPFSSICKLPKGKALGQLMAHSKLAHLKNKKDPKGHKEMPTLTEIIRQRKAKGQTPVAVNPPPVEEVEVEAEVETAAPEPVAEEKPKVRRKRRTKAQIAADKAAAAAAAAEEEDAVLETPKQTNGEAKSNGHSKKATTAMMLFVDALPAKSTWMTVTLSEYLRTCKDAIQESEEIPYWNLLKFREGETKLAAYCEEYIRNTGKPIEAILCDSTSIEWKACGDVLTELADVVVRGL